MASPKLGNLRLAVNLTDLLVFQVLAETKSMTAAAQRLGVTQSAVSQSIGRLEGWLATTLIDRSSRPLGITRTGEILWRGSTEILHQVQRTVEEVQVGSDAQIPIVRLGMVDSFATTAGPEVVRALQPRVEQLRIWSGIAPSLSAELLDHSLDLIVTVDPMADHPDLARELLFREALVAAVPRPSEQRFRELSLDQMCGELPLIRYSSRSHMGQVVRYFLSQRRLAPPGALEFDVSEAVFSMVASGLGWAITSPLCALQARVLTLDVALVPLPPPTAYRDLFLVYRPSEMQLVALEIGRICRASLETSILPKLRGLAPWASAEIIEVQPG